LKKRRLKKCKHGLINCAYCTDAPSQEEKEYFKRIFRADIQELRDNKTPYAKAINSYAERMKIKYGVSGGKGKCYERLVEVEASL